MLRSFEILSTKIGFKKMYGDHFGELEVGYKTGLEGLREMLSTPS